MNKLNFYLYQPTLPKILTSPRESNILQWKLNNKQTNKQDHVQNRKDCLNSHMYVQSVPFYIIRNIKFKKRQSHRGKDSGIVLQKIYQVNISIYIFFFLQNRSFIIDWVWRHRSSVLRSNKTAVIREASLLLFCYAPSFVFKTVLFPLTNKNYISPQ